MIKNSRFKNYYSTADEDLKIRICSHTQQLIDENSEYNDRKNFGYLCNLYVGLALIYALEERGKSRPEAIEEMKKAMYSFVQPSVKQMENLSKWRCFVPFLKWAMPIKFKMVSGYGWDLEFPKADKNTYAMTVHKCIYATLYQKYRIPELTAVFCGVDNLVYDNLPGAEFCSTQRLGEGGMMCDYCFKRRGK